MAAAKQNGRLPPSDRAWSTAVRKAAYDITTIEDEAGRKKKVKWISILAARLVKEAADGDIQAMKEVGDRLDGKPAQAVSLEGDNIPAFAIVFNGITDTPGDNAKVIEAEQPTIGFVNGTKAG